MSVLGAIFIENEAIAEIPFLRPDHFYQERHRWLFAIFLELRSRAVPIDMVTVKALLDRDNRLGQVGGVPYLVELVGFVPSPSTIKHYAEIVRDMAYKRSRGSELTRLATLAYDGVSADALEGEIQRVLETEQPQGQLPALITRNIEVVSGATFYRRNKEAPARRWVVEGLLARREISLWSGKVEAGKTTLLRTLCICVMRGQEFLGRWASPGRVLYVMLDADGEDVTFEEFNKLGWRPDSDEIDFLIDPVMALRPHSFEQFHQQLLELKPSLVIIDPLGRFKKIDDFLGYETTYAMAEFSELAKRADTHIALLHHIPRGRGDQDDAATAGFGSIAIAGGCNARFVIVKKPGNVHIFRTSQGKGGGFVPFEGDQVLTRDEETHWISLKGPYDWRDAADALKPSIKKLLEEVNEWMTTSELARELGVQRSMIGAAGKSLAKNGDIQMEPGDHNKVFWGAAGLQPQLFKKKGNVVPFRKRDDV